MTKKNYGMKPLFASKKGQARVYLGIIIILFTFGFMNMFAFALLTEFIDGFTAAGIYTVEAQAAVNPIVNALKLLDYVIVLVVIVLAVGVALTSFRVAVSPAFYVIQFFAIVFYGFISYFMNFVFQALVSHTFFTATKVFFTNTLIITSNLHWILLANFIIGVITFFAKKEKGQFLA